MDLKVDFTRKPLFRVHPWFYPRPWFYAQTGTKSGEQHQ
jgi:hypothetical protein